MFRITFFHKRYSLPFKGGLNVQKQMFFGNMKIRHLWLFAKRMLIDFARENIIFDCAQITP